MRLVKRLSPRVPFFLLALIASFTHFSRPANAQFLSDPPSRAGLTLRKAYLDGTKTRDHETGYIIESGTGRLLLRKTGERTSLEYTLYEMGWAKDNIMLHTHPDGSSFSLLDIACAMSGDAAEAEVIGYNSRHKRILYGFVRPKDGWPSLEFVANLYTIEEWLEDLEESQHHYNDAWWYDYHEHIIWMHVFKTLGIHYEKRVMEDELSRFQFQPRSSLLDDPYPL